MSKETNVMVVNRDRQPWGRELMDEWRVDGWETQNICMEPARMQTV